MALSLHSVMDGRSATELDELVQLQVVKGEMDRLEISCRLGELRIAVLIELVNYDA